MSLAGPLGGEWEMRDSRPRSRIRSHAPLPVRGVTSRVRACAPSVCAEAAATPCVCTFSVSPENRLETCPGWLGLRRPPGSVEGVQGQRWRGSGPRGRPGSPRYTFLLWVCWSGPGARAGRRGAGWEKAVSLEKSGNLQALAVARGRRGRTWWECRSLGPPG